MTCVVVASGEDTRIALAALLKSLGMEATLLASPGDLRPTLLETPTCGIMFDLATLVKAAPDDKESAQEFTELYPFAKFRLVGQEVLIPGKSLQAFVDECRKFTPRVLRSEARRPRYLALYLSADDQFEDAEASVTINISFRGCFVFSARQWEVGQQLWLRLPGYDPVVSGTVSACQPWGNNKLIPGVGIKLDEDGHDFWGAACEPMGGRDPVPEQR